MGHVTYKMRSVPLHVKNHTLGILPTMPVLLTHLLNLVPPLAPRTLTANSANYICVGTGKINLATITPILLYKLPTFSHALLHDSCPGSYDQTWVCKLEVAQEDAYAEEAHVSDYDYASIPNKSEIEEEGFDGRCSLGYLVSPVVIPYVKRTHTYYVSSKYS